MASRIDFYVQNNPVNRIDPYGLTERDVNNIIQTYYALLDRMTQEGKRHPFGAWNNICRDIYDLSDSDYCSNYMYCWQQTEVVKESLGKLNFDDEWKIVEMYRPGHFWLNAVPLTGHNPVIELDPLWGGSKIVWPIK